MKLTHHVQTVGRHSNTSPWSRCGRELVTNYKNNAKRIGSTDATRMPHRSYMDAIHVLIHRYPAVSDYQDREFGISPHVDTSFFTILVHANTQPVLRSKYLLAYAHPSLSSILFRSHSAVGCASLFSIP